MPAGKYRHRIVINNPPGDASRDNYGRRKGVGSLVAQIWAEKQDWQGIESTDNGREIASVTTKWKIRYRTDITTGMQIVHGSDTYNIESVLDFDGRKRELLLTSTKEINK